MDNATDNDRDNTSKVRQVLRSKAITEGAGVHLKRAFSLNKATDVDPFLMQDEFHSSNPEDYRMGFPWHLHRGMETITYMLSGVIEHGNSLGNLVIFDSYYWTEVKAGDKGIRYLLLSGKPLREPVAWRGPVVMNTEEELRQAFEEYRENRFVKEDISFTESSG
jgi:redox-sensitive bicupin YhaK (pirin superfamily)